MASLRSQPAGRRDTGPWRPGSEVRIFGDIGDDLDRKFGDARLVGTARVDADGHFEALLHTGAGGAVPRGRVAVRGTGQDGAVRTTVAFI
jgi:hypothetical protein